MGHLGPILGPSWGNLGAIVGPFWVFPGRWTSKNPRLEASDLRVGLGGIREALTIRPHDEVDAGPVLTLTQELPRRFPRGPHPAEALA